GTNSNNSFLNNHISNVLLGYVIDSNTGQVDLMNTGNFVGTEMDGEHIIEDIVMSGVYLLNQNGATVDNVQFLSLNRPDDGTNTAPATISTTGALPSGMLTNPIVISNNTIKDQYSPSTTIFGMYLNQRNVHYEVYNNRLHNITTDGTGTTYSAGIMLFGTGTTADIYNNMVSGISAPNSSGVSVRGIYVRTFNSVNIFYNSVLIDYAATEAGNISAALSIHNINDPVDLRNNIFINKTTIPALGTGFVTAFLKNTAALGNIQATSDNNIYYAGTPSEQNFIFYGSSTANDQTLAEYQARAVNFDQNSYTEDVPFLATDNLHIDPLAETAVRGNASPITSPIAITTDINGKERDTENPDIGAQELPEAYPAMALNPMPENGATEVSIDLAEIQWQYFSSLDFVDPAGFKVYFGTTETPGEDELLGWVVFDTETENYPFSLAETELDYETTYYWMIVPSVDEEDGPDAQNPVTWSFTTEEDTTTPDLYTLTLTLAGEGTVEVDGTLYTEPVTVEEGTELELVALAAAGWLFEGWSGDVDATEATILVTMDSDKNITATFIPVPPPACAHTPVPADGETDVPSNTPIGWTYTSDPDFSDPTGFTVNMWTGSTDGDPFQVDLPGGPGETLYPEHPFAFDFEVSYFWQVVPYVEIDEVIIHAEGCPIWSFTIAEDDVNVNDLHQNAFNIYPNPASDRFQVEWEGQAELYIIGMDGRVHDSMTIQGPVYTVSTEAIPDGMYVIRIVSGQQVISRIIRIAR
ncbi:MAG: T9SS type A sorting domain-containing protein, partial [Bacteroidales bacterium]|nr:T9SS type A sorting domain-containing protein [Bacteroidales bacterium]